VYIILVFSFLGGLDMIYFGDRLRALRLERDLTQQQLADKIGLVKSSISAYEQNAKYPSIEVLIKICECFNVSSDYLIGISDSMEYKLSALTDGQMKMILQLITELEQYNMLKDKK
jgi:transcriptional regulator with XRE-family HTH domain